MSGRVSNVLTQNWYCGPVGDLDHSIVVVLNTPIDDKQKIEAGTDCIEDHLDSKVGYIQ